jgi:hypothetical protein
VPSHNASTILVQNICCHCTPALLTGDCIQLVSRRHAQHRGLCNTLISPTCVPRSAAVQDWWGQGADGWCGSVVLWHTDCTPSSTPGHLGPLRDTCAGEYPCSGRFGPAAAFENVNRGSGVPFGLAAASEDISKLCPQQLTHRPGYV